MMTKTIYYTASTLDGYIADPEHTLDWLLQFGEPPSTYHDFVAGVGAVAMGSTTYQWLVDHLAAARTEGERAWPYAQPAWVFTSRSLSPYAGGDIQFVSGDVRPVHRAMVEAAAGKNVWLVGGGELVGQFHDHGLVDELIVQIASATLGAGAPLLPRRIVTPPLRLLSITQYGEAFAELRYSVSHPGRA